MTEWIAASGTALVALLVLLVPGIVIGVAAGLRGAALVGLAGPLSIAMIGGVGVIGGQLGVSFSPAVVGLAILPAALIGLALRRLIGPDPDLGAGTSSTALLLVSASVAAAVSMGVVAFHAVPTPDLVSQTYDGVFHVNAVSYILGTGDASSFHLYRMTHPSEGIEFYPAAWHSTVAVVCELTGASVAVATNATWIAATGAVAAAGGGWLASILLPRSRRTLAVTTGALATGATAAGPYVLLQWGVLYPTGLAYALLPAGLALAVLVVRRSGIRDRLAPTVFFLVWFGASVFAHPRSLVSFAALALPLVVLAVIDRIRTGLALPDRRRRTIVVVSISAAVVVIAAVGAAVAVLRYFRADVRPISDRLNGGPATARVSFGEAVSHALLLAPPSGPGEATLPAALVAALVVLAGVVLAFRSRELRWVAVSYVLVIVLYALAAGSNADFAKLATGFWYKDKFRLFALLGVLAPPLIAIAASWVAGRVTRRRGAHPRLLPAATAGLGVLLLVTAWAGPSLSGMGDAVARNYAVDARKDGRLLDADELALLHRLPDLVPAGSVIAGNPWDGSALTWAIGERESLFPHLTGEWSADQWTVIQRLDQAATDPNVCEALDRLGVRYVLSSDGLLWNGNPQADVFAAVSRAASAPGFATVAEVGGNRLLEITACR